MSALQTISPQLRHWRRKALLNRVEGLTTHGTPRKRRPNNGLAFAKLLAQRERGLLAWNRRVNRLREQGLTTRGTPRIYAMRRGDALLMKSQVDALASALAGIFPDLPAPAQARALELERSLSAVRKQLL